MEKKCFCDKLSGLWIALFGLTFLLKNAGLITDEINNWIWPSLILLGGLQKIASDFCKCCSEEKCTPIKK